MARFWILRKLNSTGTLSLWKGNIPRDYFNNIKIINYRGLDGTFNSNTNLKGAVSFPNLTIVKEEGLRSCFEGCENLTSVSFPNLTTIEVGGLALCFYNCKKITSVSFPKLTTIGSEGLRNCFSYCKPLTSVSFPKLTTINGSGLIYCFSGSEALKEIHFRADVRSVIESLSGYSNKFGASNATIYFDL